MRQTTGDLGIRQARAEPDTYAPDGSEIRLLIGDDDRIGRTSMCEVRLPPGLVSRPVRHRTVEEIWYVLAGVGRVWRSPPSATGLAPSVVDVGPGDALAIPVGWAFQFQAMGVEPLRFLCYTSPPWPGEGEAVAESSGGLGEPTV